jgi:hypothetical protein
MPRRDVSFHWMHALGLTHPNPSDAREPAPPFC